MAIELKVPQVGESITEVEIGEWLKKQGEQVNKDEPVVTLESEKATVELPAPESGTLSRVLKSKGETANVGEVIGYLEDSRAGVSPVPAQNPGAAPSTQARSPARGQAASSPQPPAPEEEREKGRPKPEKGEHDSNGAGQDVEVLHGPSAVSGGGASSPQPSPPEEEREKGRPKPDKGEERAPVHGAQAAQPARQEEVVRMSRLRRTVAERLVEAQRTAALLTTFNEIDMSAVQMLRQEHGEAFRQKYDVKLGLMCFFVKAVIDGLKQFPLLNAEVREDDIVYHNFFDIGIAIGSGKGLVVPVLRNAERLSFAEIELSIADFARRAQENKLKLEELRGGTFTISNGGVYGSLLSTPIINPPQSGVLGLHAIQERPVARQGSVVVRPMMYVALTYDHRIVDGREAVSFLKRVKETVETPARMLIEV